MVDFIEVQRALEEDLVEIRDSAVALKKQLGDLIECTNQHITIINFKLQAIEKDIAIDKED